MSPRKITSLFVPLLALLISLIFFNRLTELVYSPMISPQVWLQDHPWIEISLFSKIWVISLPTSTIFVYLLGFVSVAFGISLLKAKDDHLSRRWWGVALVAWGIGALFAGTSYQALSYELKCAGSLQCLWTTWLEILYLACSVASINAMMVAQVISCVPERYHSRLFSYAVLHTGIYLVVLTIGTVVPVRFLVSFELMLLLVAPSIIFFLYINVARYRMSKNPMDRALIKVWVGLGVVMVAYYAYFLAGVTEWLWARNIWFSANDVLHIGLILWMFGIKRTVSIYVVDG